MHKYTSLNALVCALLIWGIPTVASADATFSDGTFNDSDWGFSVNSNFTGNDAVAVQILSGGNPGLYRLNTAHLVGPGSSSQSNLEQVNEQLSFQYDPSTQGAITSIDLSIDDIFLGNLTAGVDFALFQNGHVYFYEDSSAFTIPDPGPTWLTSTVLSATATDFHPEGSGPPPPVDFSTTGAPIQFGYLVSNATAFNLDYSDAIGIDNLSVTVHTVPEPCGFAILSLSAASILVRRRN